MHAPLGYAAVWRVLLCSGSLTSKPAAIRWGPLGYLAYGGVYALLELAIIPAIPLTMTAGVLFGALPGLAVVSASGTLAATLSFLIARYAARDKVCGLSPLASPRLQVDTACPRSEPDAAEEWYGSKHAQLCGNVCTDARPVEGLVSQAKHHTV